MNQQTVICLIHGHGVDASIWDSVYAELALNNPVLKPNFSQRTDLPTIEAYAIELREQLRAENAQKVILVGHSMGGYISLAFAEKFPAMMQGLVLCHSTATADDDARKENRRQAIAGLKTNGRCHLLRSNCLKWYRPAIHPKKRRS